jgi:hypothetical protein
MRTAVLSFIGMSKYFDPELAVPVHRRRVEGKNKGMQALAGGPFTQRMEHHPSSKARIPTQTARPYVDYRVCRLAGIVFGNPSVALSLVVPRRGSSGSHFTAVPTGTEHHRRVP